VFRQQKERSFYSDSVEGESCCDDGVVGGSCCGGGTEGGELVQH